MKLFIDFLIFKEYWIIIYIRSILASKQRGKGIIHFIGAEGAHHVLSVDGVEKFEHMREEINTISFVANNPGIINYLCYVHLSNKVSQNILVLLNENVKRRLEKKVTITDSCYVWILNFFFFIFLLFKILIFQHSN